MLVLRLTILLAFLTLSGIAVGQQPDTTTVKTTISIPFEPGLAFRLAVLGFKKDSVERVINRRNRVRSVAKISLDKAPADTISYVEFDRRGNPMMDYNPAFRARNRTEYNQLDQCTRVTTYASSVYELAFESTYDARSRTTLTEVILPSGKRELYQRAVQTQVGDTALIVAALHKTAYNAGDQITKLVQRIYPYRQDTTLMYTKAYTAGGLVLSSTVQYFIKANGMRVEEGDVSYNSAIDKLAQTDKTAQQLRSKLSDAAFYDTLAHRVKPIFTPTSLLSYNASKLLTKQQFLPPAHQQKALNRDAFTNTGSATVSINVFRSMVQYTRNKAGQLTLKELYLFDDPIFGNQPIREEFRYSPKGLLLETKNSQVEKQNDRETTKVRRYRYAYTFY